MAGMQQAQLLAVAGFVMLGWVLARRQLKMRKRVNRETRVANRELEKIRTHREPQLPLADAPPETQRWQVALFDLQRELKAELDTRIVVVQTLLRQVDDRIARLEKLQSSVPSESLTTGPSRQAPISISQAQIDQIAAMVRDGFTTDEIAAKTGLPIGDVEISVATMRVG